MIYENKSYMICNFLVDAQEPHALDTERTTGTLTLFKSRLMSLTNSPFCRDARTQIGVPYAKPIKE